MTRVMLMIVRAKQGTKGLLHGIIHIYDNSVTQVYYSPFCKWGTKAQRSLMTCLKSPRKLGSVLGYHCSHSVCLRKFIHILWFPLLQKQTDDNQPEYLCKLQTISNWQVDISPCIRQRWQVQILFIINTSKLSLLLNSLFSLCVHLKPRD